ncbi:DinB family protein [Gorillibacterium sp. sgz5001074]|uniref:DinB family protein n=1 Tax=Gorillibacterium sp. sgz5001074 TaxID=3446695 RepID=UPI003F67B01D
MGLYLFDQLDFVRRQTLKALEGIGEEQARQVPEGFRNSIHWHAGHIYTAAERLALFFVGLPLQFPEDFPAQFGNGTSPLTPPEGAVSPTLEELKVMLAGQPARVRAALEHRLQESIAQPYTTSTGMTLHKPEEFLSFSLYHEGMHFSVINQYKRLLV